LQAISIHAFILIFSPCPRALALSEFCCRPEWTKNASRIKRLQFMSLDPNADVGACRASRADQVGFREGKIWLLSNPSSAAWRIIIELKVIVGQLQAKSHIAATHCGR